MDQLSGGGPLQPAVQTGEGAGATLGLGYLNLKPDPLNQARVATPRGGLFAKVLYSGYFDAAYIYRKRPDYAGSDFFSGKSIEAASGVPPLPLAVLSQRADTKRAHDRLMSALRYVHLAPIDVARAQVGYDCWIYALTHDANDDANSCGAAMTTHLAMVGAAAAEDAAIRASEAKVAERARWNLLQPIWFTVLFATDSSTLNREAAIVVNKAIERLSGLEEANIVLYGSADQIGSKKYKGLTQITSSNTI